MLAIDPNATVAIHPPESTVRLFIIEAKQEERLVQLRRQLSYGATAEERAEAGRELDAMPEADRYKPEHFVVVELHVGVTSSFSLLKPEALAIAGSLEEARGALEAYAPSLVRIELRPDEDTRVAEVWTDAATATRLRALQTQMLFGGFL